MYDIQLINVDMLRDAPILFNYIDADDQYLFFTKTTFTTQNKFRKWLMHKFQTAYHDFYMIRYRTEIIGFVHNYNFNVLDGRCTITVYIDKTYRKSGLGAYAAVKFMGVLFQTYPLRKIYATVYDYNTASLKMIISAGFSKEGTLHAYRYFDDKYADLHILSLDRETFNKKLGKLCL